MRHRSFATTLMLSLLACGSAEGELGEATPGADPSAAPEVATSALLAPSSAGWREETSGIDSFATSVSFDGRLGTVLYAGGSRLYASWDLGAHWRGGRDVQQHGVVFNDVVSDPNRAGRVYAMRGGDRFVSETGGLFWQLRAAAGRSVLAVSPGSSDTLWGPGCGTLAKSLDRGETWSDLPLPVSGCVQMVVAISASEVYLHTYDHVLHSRDGGATWPIVSDAGLLGVNWMSVDRKHPQVVYAVNSYEATPERAGLRKSTDGGLTWSAPSASYAAVGAQTVSVSPVDGRVYVTAYTGGVPRIEVSVDGGVTFASADLGLPPSPNLNGPVVPSPWQACVAAIASNSGVFRTFDSGGRCH
jgi:hypothetical protein